MRVALPAAAFLISVCTLLFFLETPVSANAAKPNVIFILTDDQRLDDIKHICSVC